MAGASESGSGDALGENRRCPRLSSVGFCSPKASPRLPNFGQDAGSLLVENTENAGLPFTYQYRCHWGGASITLKKGSQIRLPQSAKKRFYAAEGGSILAVRFNSKSKFGKRLQFKKRSEKLMTVGAHILIADPEMTAVTKLQKRPHAAGLQARKFCIIWRGSHSTGSLSPASFGAGGYPVNRHF